MVKIVKTVLSLMTCKKMRALRRDKGQERRQEGRISTFSFQPVAIFLLTSVSNPLFLDPEGVPPGHKAYILVYISFLYADKSSENWYKATHTSIYRDGGFSGKN